MKAFIREVKINNYKTYKNTKIKFNEGINTLVGPNGSGKSNAIEAILFGLGERSLKVFRANNFRDIVHNPRGENINKSGVEVSVTLVIVDSKGKEHLFKRVYRPKKNSHIYFYNKKRVSRGTYISKLLTIGGDGFHYVYIPQGGILSQANLTSKDLKNIVNEALGISKFDEKKREALTRLEKAELKLAALNDKQGILREMVDKLLNQMVNLERRENTDRLLRRLRAAKYTLHIDSLMPEMDKLKDKLDKTKEIKEKYKKKVYGLEKSLNKIDEKISKLEIELEERGMEKYRKLLERKSVINTNLNNLINLLAVKERTINNIVSRIDLLNNELKNIRVKVSEKTSSIRELNKTIRMLEKDANQLAKEREKNLEEIRNLEKELNETYKLKKDVVGKRESLIKNRIKIEADILANKRIKRLYEDRLKDIDTKIQNYEKLIDTIEERMDQINNSLQKIEEELSKINRERDQFIAKKKRVGDEIDNAEKLLSKVDNYINKVKKEKIYSPLPEYKKDAKYMIKIAKDMNIKGIVGIFGELIKGPKEIKTLLKDSLEEEWYSIIVKDISTANKIFKISYDLRKKTIIKPLTKNISNIKSHDKSVVNVIKYPKTLEPLVIKYFGSLVIVTDPEEAYNYLTEGLSVVHKRGEFLITSDSWVYKGKKKKIIITKDLDKLVDIYTTFKEMIELRRKDIKSYESSINKLNDKLKDKEIERSRLIETNKLLNQNLKFLRDLTKFYIKRQKDISNILKREYKDSDLKKIEKDYVDQVTKLDKLIDNLRIKISNLSTIHSDIVNKIADINKNIEINKQFIDSLIEDIKDIKSKKEVIRGQLAVRKEERKKIREEIKDINRQIKDLEREEKKIENEIEKFTKETMSIKEKLDGYKKERNELNERWLEYNKKINNLSNDETRIMYSLKELEAETDRFKEKRIEVGYFSPVYISHCRDIGRVEKLIEEYEEELNSIMKDEYYPTPSARDEYLGKIEPYKQFSINKSKLEEERNAILDFINEIDEERERIFREGFKKIKDKLEKLFSKVFPDSYIYFDLEDPENIDSEIQLYIEFKEKPKLPIFSLSGGEKSLTIILFLISVYSIPGNVVFLLDEIDAHVDPRNLNQFAEAILTQKEESQIIFVTLPRDEILAKMADYLITIFFRNGISKPITIPKDMITGVIKNK